WNKKNRFALSKIGKVRSSSTLPDQQGFSYKAEHLLDGNPKTAWCADKKDKNPFIEIRSKDGSPIDFSNITSRVCSLEGLFFTGGHLYNQKIYLQNNRISKVLFTDCSNSGKHTVAVRPSSDYRTAYHMIKGYEKFNFIKENSCIRIHFTDTVKGKDNDTCISELSLIFNCF
ncbi:MAG: discoidin domain-containing protein, partial [Spirochaetia bacterium]|nr:discoidin domain-containing protein [Spirochaetia bacterium]